MPCSGEQISTITRFYWLRGRAGGPVALPDHACQPIPRPRQREGGRLRRRLRHLRADPRARARGLRRRALRGLQRAARGHPTRRDRHHARRVLQGRRRRRRDGQLRLLRRARWPSTGSPSAPTSSTWPPPASPARWPTATGAWSPARSARARSSPPSARSASPSSATPTRCRPNGLLEGGVDVLLVETQFDLLGAKAAMIGCRRAMAATGREVPIQVQVTMELTGTMLPGTEIGAALAALDAMRPDVIGINCATGPAEMSEHLRYLGQHSRVPIACLPNAGLPSVVEGQMHYDLTPSPAGRVPEPLRPRLRRAGGRRLLRHHRRAHRRRSSRPSRTSPRRPAPSSTRTAPPRSTASRPSSSSSPTSRSASARTPTAPRSSARPCSTATGTRASPWRASRRRRAPTSSTCASTTSAATAPPTWTRSRPASPPRPPSR